MFQVLEHAIEIRVNVAWFTGRGGLF